MTSGQVPPGQRGAGQHAAGNAEAAAVLGACRVLVAVSAQSIAAVGDVADLTQVRALVIVASRGSVSLGELATAANIHLTRASRLCDRLVAKGLINRADDPADRRQLILTLTPTGGRVVDTVMKRRRQVIEPMLARMRRQMTGHRRAELVSLLQDFAAAGGEPSDPDLWAMGWTT
ncbi:MAG: MarR family transcriptional regulator [Actinomycetota bacterium]|nr:MarR family transcriptional regulator [Actinomycetota bacterium]